MEYKFFSVENHFSVNSFIYIDVIDKNDGTYTIEGVQFNDSIYAAADTSSELAYTDITAFDETPDVPSNLQHSVIVVNTP